MTKKGNKYQVIENLDNATLMLNQYDGFSMFNDGHTITTNSSAYDEVIEKLVDLDKLEAPCVRNSNNNNNSSNQSSKKQRIPLNEPMPNQHIYMSGGRVAKESVHTINSLCENDTFTQSSLNPSIVFISH